ncbi:MAG: 16S rRNA (guanine(527)-N(7))-methyltransferase RsmG [Lactobacillaceae bacterium]|nr:16S rRNA (guanine(527)-N(7))-methyltransferase RsmG [Lactobacillaceae bacterium]
MDKNEVISALEDQGIKLSALKIKQLDIYFQDLINTNKSLNLTTIIEELDVWIKHFYDSITPLIYFPKLDEKISIADVGTGAGFPGMVLSIVNPKLEVTLIDSLKKRLNFLNELIEKLNLKNVKTEHYRAEDIGNNLNYRESFDFVTARAVSNTATLLEYLMPLAKVNGTIILFKSASYVQELNDAKNAIKILGGEIGSLFEFNLPNGNPRTLIEIKKIKQTPKKYPRQAGTPSKNPIK